MICLEVHDDEERFYRLTIWRLRSLRLTCREINAKTYDLFARLAFKHRFVRLSLPGLDRLKDISENALFASKIESLMLIHYDKHGSLSAYKKLEANLENPELTRSAMDEIRAKMMDIRKEQDEMEFMERSGIDNIALATAIQSFPKLRELRIGTTANDTTTMRHGRSGNNYNTTRMFLLLATAVPIAKAWPQKLRCVYIRSDDKDAISIQAMALPQACPALFQQMTEMDLYLETRNENYRSMHSQLVASN